MGGTETNIRLATRELTETDIIHIYCTCDPDLALCGEDISDAIPDTGPNVCLVCEDLEDFPCEGCGV